MATVVVTPQGYFEETGTEVIVTPQGIYESTSAAAVTPTGDVWVREDSSYWLREDGTFWLREGADPPLFLPARHGNKQFLYPGRKPVGPVKVDWSHPSTEDLLSYGLGLYDIAAEKALDYYVSRAENEADYLHFNDPRSADAIMMPHLKGCLSNVAGFTYSVLARFHGGASTNEDMLGLQWESLQGSGSPSAQSFIFRFNSSPRDLQIIVKNSGNTQYSHTVQADLIYDVRDFHLMTVRLLDGQLAIFLNGEQLSGTLAFSGVMKMPTAKYPEILGGHNVTGSSKTDAPRFDLKAWGLWKRGLSDEEIAAQAKDFYQYLTPA